MAKSIFSVSLSSDIGAVFDKESNKSALVEVLLRKHYDTPADLELLKSEVAKKEQMITTIQQKQTQIIETEAAKIARQKQQKEEQLGHLKILFKQEIGRDVTDEELSNYLELFDAGLTNFYDFCGELKNGS